MKLSLFRTATTVVVSSALLGGDIAMAAKEPSLLRGTLMAETVNKRELEETCGDLAFNENGDLFLKSGLVCNFDVIIEKAIGQGDTVEIENVKFKMQNIQPRGDTFYIIRPSSVVCDVDGALESYKPSTKFFFRKRGSSKKAWKGNDGIDYEINEGVSYLGLFPPSDSTDVPNKVPPPPSFTLIEGKVVTAVVPSNIEEIKDIRVIDVVGRTTDICAALEQ